MARWSEVQAEAPDLAALVERRFKAHKHAFLATLRRDGSPRVSGVETQWALGDLWMGMMGGSRKALDLLRDPRLALHSPSDEPDLADGDARVSGRAEAVEDPGRIDAWRATLEGEVPGPFHLFRVDVDEVVTVRVAGDRLVVTTWRPGHGIVTVERT
ncbi:MAG: pyridoxamine 5'-phosphate oxidase family protein [Actinomycetota bacterium]